MSIEKSYTVTLKIARNEDGSFESVRLLKGRSQLTEDVLVILNKTLQESLIPPRPVKTTIELGNDAEQMIMNHLLLISKVNSNFNVNDTSSMTGHGDIAISYQSKKICIEVKNYTKPVPMKEIEKYHRSLALPEYDIGIIIQVGECGFARESGIRSPIDIQIQDGKPSAYLTAINLEMIYPIISLLITNINLNSTIDQNELESKRKALLQMYEKITDLRNCIEAQKKSIAKMEALVDEMAKLST